jgi:hypothetical protein
MLAAPGRVLTVLVGRERGLPTEAGCSRWIDLDAARIAHWVSSFERQYFPLPGLGPSADSAQLGGKSREPAQWDR